LQFDPTIARSIRKLIPAKPQGACYNASMKIVEIDRSKPLSAQPHTGHNRWHPDIPAIVEAAPGEEVVLQTRDALDGQITWKATEAVVASLNPGPIHPLTGPVLIKGAKPGDLLEIEFLEINPERFAFTCILPGLGFLADQFTTPFLVKWKIENGFATAEQLPGVRIAGASFMGVSGTAPSHEKLREWTKREADAMVTGKTIFPPDPGGAVPASGPAATYGLRTVPPREHGGNFDVKQLTKGSKLFLPVYVDGALFSTGDGHFAQGDGEVCVTAVEMAATASMRFQIHKGEASRKNINAPRFSHSGYFSDPQWASPKNFTATMGMPIRQDGSNDAENLNLATRNALLSMIDLLQDRGFSKEQAYCICSVAVDLRISNVVDVPNFVVSALLPEDIFVK
jgi:formamidase